MSIVPGKRNIVSIVASGNLDFAEPAKFRFVRKIGDDVLLPNANGQVVYGVIQNNPRDNEHASVCVEGYTKMTFGASLGVDAPIMTNNSGFAILATSWTINYVAGRTYQAADSGKVGSVLLAPTGVYSL